MLLVAILATSCASAPRTESDELEMLRSTIVSVVDDAERESAMLEAIDQMDATVADLGELVNQDRENLQELLRDPATPRTEIEMFIAEHTVMREEIVGQMADAHFEFKELASPDEWKELSKAAGNAYTLIALRSLGEAALVE